MNTRVAIGAIVLGPMLPFVLTGCPAIVGIDTLAIVVSSTTRKLPSPIRIAAT